MLGKREREYVKPDAAEVGSTLGNLIAAADLSEKQRTWAEVRWQREAVWMYRFSMTLRRRFTTVRIVAIFASLITPVAAGIGTNSGALGIASRSATVVIGVIGAAAVAIDQILKDGVRWRLYRAGFDSLSREGWAYFNREGRYAVDDPNARFSLFFAAVEQAITDREEKYRSDVAGIVDRALIPSANTPA